MNTREAVARAWAVERAKYRIKEGEIRDNLGFKVVGYVVYSIKSGKPWPTTLPLPKPECEAHLNALCADAAIAAHLQALKDAGMVVVPREPTEAMREAGNRINSEWTEIEGDAEVQLPGSPMIWRAMIQESDNG